MDDAMKSARRVLEIEAKSVAKLIEKLDDNFGKAVSLIFNAKGRLIVTGIGKSGLIGRKIAATMTSTGTQALFLHPVEGMHGDMGIVGKGDVILALSNSGETEELNMILATVRELGVKIIAFTGKKKSTLAALSTVVIDTGVEKEACPFGMTPTASTTAALAMGDALAVALMEKRKFGEEDFCKFHPGGTLGMRLFAKVAKAMVKGSRVPQVKLGIKASKAVKKMNDKNVGFVIVTDQEGELAGILTDGDIRRHICNSFNFNEKLVDEVMSRSPKTIGMDASLAEAIAKMQKLEITTLVVTSADNKVLGYLHLHDILGRGGNLRVSVSL
ncbi:MAG: KpsF/GutQ family sugar-phosphate isomerase [Deltaproteobacteria bacterium]|nr:KpsF/GutQ family sugar-phosphate isomerase [Deltaproteobacteria bacterium]